MQYESSKESDVLDSAPNEEKKAAMINLRKTFGSKKDKRRTEQFERMIINVENVKEVLEKTVAGNIFGIKIEFHCFYNYFLIRY